MLLAGALLVWTSAAAARGNADEPGAPAQPEPGAAARPAHVALLGVAGSTALAAALDRELPAALAARRAKHPALPRVASAQQLAAALRADPATQKHLAAAAAALERADKAALYMKRGGAVSSARQAIAELDEALARFVAPRKLARAHAALAYALLLAPADEVGARDALHAAVTADANFTPDADRNSPTVKRLLAEARAKLRVAPPDSASLDKLASRARLARLVWLSAAAAAGGASTVDLEVQIYEVSARAVRTRLSKRVTRAELVASAAALVEQALAGDKAIAGGTGSGGAGSGNGGAGPAGTPGGGAAASATPWYKRWWIWAIAGAVVAGAGVGLGVGLTRGDGGSTTPPPNPNGFDIIFRH